MAHIVFLTYRFFPQTDANAACAYNVMEEMLSAGHEVTCLCGGDYCSKEYELVNGVRVLRVKHTAYSDQLEKSMHPVQRLWLKGTHIIHSVFLLKDFPNVEKSFSKQLSDALERIERDHHIDLIIGVFRPSATIFACLDFKRKHPDSVIVGWYLDVLKGAVKPPLIPKKYYDELCDSREVKIFAEFNRVYLPEHGRFFYMDFPTSLDEKIRYINFPTLKLLQKQDPSTCDGIRLIYAGVFDRDYRNPMKFFHSLSLLKERHLKIVFDYYGTSNMEDEIDDYISKHPGLIQKHGRVSKDKVDEENAKADYLISIGNNIRGILPSKTFELIGTKKPIIHFTDGDTDEALNYYRDYPNICIISKTDSPEQMAENIFGFIQSEKETISDEQILTRYRNASPKVIADYFLKETAYETIT